MDLQTVILILSSSVVGGIALKLLDWLRDGLQGQMKKRRAEVDKAISERDAARVERDQARAEAGWWERWSRIVEEALAVTRRKFIDTPGTDPADLDPYPSRPDRSKP